MASPERHSHLQASPRRIPLSGQSQSKARRWGGFPGLLYNTMNFTYLPSISLTVFTRSLLVILSAAVRKSLQIARILSNFASIGSHCFRIWRIISTVFTSVSSSTQPYIFLLGHGNILWCVLRNVVLLLDDLLKPHWARYHTHRPKETIALLALTAELLYGISILAELQLEPAKNVPPMPHSQLPHSHVQTHFLFNCSCPTVSSPPCLVWVVAIRNFPFPMCHPCVGDSIASVVQSSGRPIRDHKHI